MRPGLLPPSDGGVPIAQLDLNDIGLDGIVICQPLTAGVVRYEHDYSVTFHVTIKDDATKVELDYTLVERGPDIVAAMLKLMTRFRREIENYDAIPDGWLTPEGLAIKEMYNTCFRPEDGEYFNPSKLQRRLDHLSGRD